MASRSTQRSSWILFHFFVLFGASYALGVLFLHITVSLCKDKEPTVEDSGKSTQPIAPPSADIDNSNQTCHNNVSHSTSQFSNDMLTHILSTSKATSVSRTLTLLLYLVATDDNSSQHGGPALLDSSGHSGIKIGLYTLPSMHQNTGHVYLYPNSTTNDR